MGYSAAVGTLVMDELASTCERTEARFTGVHTDLGIIENDTAIVKDQVRILGDWMDGTNVELCRMRVNRVVIQDKVDRLRVTMHEMRQDMGILVHMNQVMYASLTELRLSTRHGWDNLIVVDDDVDSVVEAEPVHKVPVEEHLVPIEDVEEGELVSDSEGSKGVWEIAREEFEQGVDTQASSPEL